MSKSHRLTGIQDLFGQRELAALIAVGQTGLALNAEWHKVAPSPLADSSRVQRLEAGVLHIAANNGAVALKLRQMAPSLARQLRERGVAAESLHIVVRPNPERPVRVAAPRSISSQGVEQLDTLAKNLPEGSDLKKALERLVRQQRR